MTGKPCGKTMDEERALSVSEGELPLDNAKSAAIITSDSTPHARSNAANQAGSCISRLKNPLTYEEQLEHLREKGLSIGDVQPTTAISYLETLNYYRLSGFWLTFLNPEKEDTFLEGTTLQQIIDVVDFDSGMRSLFLDALEPVEVKFRARFAYELAHAYGADALTQKTPFKNQSQFVKACKTIDREVSQAKRSRIPFVLHNLERYGQLPIWATVEVLSLGTLSKLFGNLSDKEISESISSSFGVSAYYFKSWIECLTQVRNMCAHYNRIYNRILVKTPAMHKQNGNVDNKREFPIFLVLVCLLNSSWPDKAHGLINDLESLILKFPNVDLEPCGFSDNWKEILLRNCERSRRA